VLQRPLEALREPVELAAVAGPFLQLAQALSLSFCSAKTRHMTRAG